MSGEKTHFGFTDVPVDAKAPRVAEVFHSVARNYDVMNDLMSLGLHRLWKAFTVGRAGVRPGARVLDIAAGSGDLAQSFARAAGPDGEVWLTDINESMLNVGRDRLLDAGQILPVALCDAEQLPFRDDYFDVVSVAFGLRNMTHKEHALSEMRRVVRPGGKVLVLEFSRIWEPLRPLYDLYSFSVLPRLGRWVADDADSYRYLAESIRVHPDQATLTQMMRTAGFDRVEVFHLAARAVALHEAVKY
jgi:demethylmenaquinone methyltransferase/2-methoxy-6-polyprenyl-1,4-benzoquinol methylase